LKDATLIGAEQSIASFKTPLTSIWLGGVIVLLDSQSVRSLRRTNILICERLSGL
jgi:hypothetical protein